MGKERFFISDLPSGIGNTNWLIGIYPVKKSRTLFNQCNIFTPVAINFIQMRGDVAMGSNDSMGAGVNSMITNFSSLADKCCHDFFINASSWTHGIIVIYTLRSHLSHDGRGSIYKRKSSGICEWFI